MNFKEIKPLIRQTFAEWSEDKASRLAAALAYYTIFSIPPLLIIVIAIAAQVFERSLVQQQIVSQITGSNRQHHAPIKPNILFFISHRVIRA